VFFAVFVWPALTNGQATFINIGAEKGLSSLQITGLYQDAHGFVWVGTPHGLNRFDGYDCVQYLNLPDDTTSLSSNYICQNGFAKDGDDNLWVATLRGGLNHFNRKTEQFTRYRAQADDPNSLSMDNLTAIEPDGKGGLWIATSGRGINHFDPKNHRFRVWNSTQGKPDLLMGSTMTRCLKLDKNGQLWIGTNKGVCRLDPTNDSFEYFPFVPGLDHSLSNSYVTDIVEDRQGNIWLGTSQGLNRWDPDRQVFVKYFFSGSFHHNKPGYDYIYKILETEDGRLWLGTVGGLLRFNPSDGVADQFLHEPDNPFSIQNGAVNTIMKDQNGNVWFGTDNGISILNYAGGKLSHERFLPVLEVIDNTAGTEGVNAVLETQDALWLGMQAGIYQYTYRASIQQISNKNFTAFFYDEEKGEVYAGTLNEGFYVYNADNFSEIRHVPNNKIDEIESPYKVKGQRINSFAKDCEGHFWIAANGCLNRFDRSTGRFRRFHNHEKNLSHPSGNTNHHLLTDRLGNLWIASMGGLSRLSKTELSKPFDHKSLQFQHFLYQAGSKNCINSDVVFCLLESAEGHIWAGTDAGLNRFDPQTGVWKWFSKSDGLPGNEIVSLVEDRNGNLWIGDAHDGLAKFDKASGRFLRFSKKDGLKTDRFRPNASLCSKEGYIILGGRAGLAGFHPDSLLQQRSESTPIYFTDFKIFNKTVPIGEGSNELALPIYQTETIELDYDQNVISFQCTALNFVNPEKQMYRYRLKPFQVDWQYNGYKREATFTNLDPGVYQLRVETSVNGYDWTGQTMTLKIHPPWYQTWWAYLLWAALFGALLYGIRQFDLKRQLAKAEALRLLELDLAKTRLYTNITHEFRTPLTVILGMEEQLRKDPESWMEEGLRLIRRNGKQLLHLVNQMLDLSKVESGHLPFRLVQGDVVGYLHYLTESFHSYADSKDIRLHFRPDSPEFQMDYDPEKMQNVVSNLLSNAIKFTPAGGDVYVEVRITNEARGQVFEIQVTDTGPGIASEHLPHIFDRFYQADERPTRANEGTGIGLALVKELVKLMGGQITAESPKHSGGKGGKFIVSLPVSRTAAKNTAENHLDHDKVVDGTVFLEANTISQMPVATPSDRHTVLLVEDNADVISYLTSVLQAHYRIITASNGQEGIEKAFELVPDIIVSDVMMPDKDGFDLCRELKTDERSSHIPIILLTAKADQSSKIEGLKYGADAYLAKPFHSEELLVRLEKLIELRKRLQGRFKEQGSLRQMLGNKAQSVDEIFLQKVLRIVETQMNDEAFGMPQLCKSLNMSRSNLFRKIKALTGQSVTEFIRNMRLEKARELLYTTDMNVAELSYAVGFGSPNYFSRVFHEAFGMSPGEVRKRRED